MHINKVVIILLIIVSTIAGCKKDSSNDNVGSRLEGGFIGGYHLNPNAPGYFFTLQFHSNGKILVQANDIADPEISIGTWTKIGDSIIARYETVISPILQDIGTKYSLAFKYSNSFPTELKGTFGTGTSTNGLGTFTVTKPAISQIRGSWMGKYNSGLQNNLPLALHFNIAGTLVVESANPSTPTITNIGFGTWVQANDSIKVTYTNKTNDNSTFSLAGNYINGSTTLTGTIGADNNTNGLGTFQVEKK